MKSLTKILASAASGVICASTALAADFTFTYGQSQPESSSRGQSMVFFEKEVVRKGFTRHRKMEERINSKRE